VKRAKARGEVCGYCGKPIDWHVKGGFIVDHKLNRRDRPDLALDLNNLHVLHQACNTRKYYNEEREGSAPAIGADGFPVGSEWGEE
jgi:5-methylcytosine-specific restriction endonuclease McrA